MQHRQWLCIVQIAGTGDPLVNVEATLFAQF